MCLFVVCRVSWFVCLFECVVCRVCLFALFDFQKCFTYFVCFVCVCLFVCTHTHTHTHTHTNTHTHTHTQTHTNTHTHIHTHTHTHTHTNTHKIVKQINFENGVIVENIGKAQKSFTCVDRSKRGVMHIKNTVVSPFLALVPQNSHLQNFLRVSQNFAWLFVISGPLLHRNGKVKHVFGWLSPHWKFSHFLFIFQEHHLEILKKYERKYRKISISLETAIKISISVRFSQLYQRCRV